MSPVVAADGPLGLEARHTWIGPGGDLVLNDLTVWPRYKLDRIVGLHSMPETDDNRIGRTFAIGEYVTPSYFRGKTLTYEGRIIGTTLQQLRAGTTALRYSFGGGGDGSNPERRMLITPHATYGTIVHTYQARVLQLDVDDAQQYGRNHLPSPFIRHFVLGLRMADPRFYEWDGTEATNPKF